MLRFDILKINIAYMRIMMKRNAHLYQCCSVRTIFGFMSVCFALLKICSINCSIANKKDYNRQSSYRSLVICVNLYKTFRNIQYSKSDCRDADKILKFKKWKIQPQWPLRKRVLPYLHDWNHHDCDDQRDRRDEREDTQGRD